MRCSHPGAPVPFIPQYELAVSFVNRKLVRGERACNFEYREDCDDTGIVRNRLLFAIPLTAILGGLSLLHAYWALGGRWGSAYTVPTIRGRRSFDPSPLATWVVCGLLALAVIIVMGKSGWIAPGRFAVLFDAGVWGLGLVFALRAVGNLRTFGFFKIVKGTPFADWDTWLYSPLCILVALLVLGLICLPRER